MNEHGDPYYINPFTWVLVVLQIASLVHRLEQVGLVRHVAKQAIT